MKLIFLGTGAGRPTLRRNVTSIALLLPQAGGRFWLFDAGEGTQHQLQRAKLKLSRLDRIFITHLHGDHLYGLPGLISSRTFHEGSGKLRLYGPPGLRGFVECALTQSELHLDYELEIHEIEPGPIALDDERFAVEAGELQHRVRVFGYRVTEAPRPGSLNSAWLAENGVEPGPLYGKLKRGEDVELPDGRKVLASEAVGPGAEGRIVTILGDTRPCEEAVRLAKNADLLVHEATFGAGMEEKAASYGHSTVLQAAETASRARARRLAVTHFSARYDDEAIDRLAADGRAIFPDILAAADFLELEIPPRPGGEGRRKAPKS
ncbi:ribonuclease Z [Cohnella zeiphila]|uniref:Ribonuclease Z n=1 Tax=Cohnella zeiphila TaxID=2761120 RepID=A0A7X0SPG2_9BACL|nr:ribonuclease Z [Cohnella zeiphila]MBB6733684.1 ribonuclease Z [Cohnella zeiphila]